MLAAGFCITVQAQNVSPALADDARAEVRPLNGEVYKIRLLKDEYNPNPWALMNNEGHLLTPFRFGEIHEEIKDGFFTFREHRSYFDRKHDLHVRYDLYGLVSAEGKVLGEGVYFLLTPEGNHWRVARKPELTHGHIAVAWQTEEDPENGPDRLLRKGTVSGFIEGVKFGYIDSCGKLICTPYDRIYPFVGDIAIVANEGVRTEPDHRYEYGCINNQGEEIIAPRFSEAEPFDPVALHDSKFRALINRQGEIVTDSFTHIRKCSREIWISEITGGYYSYIDATTGERLSRFYAHMECPRADGMPTPVLLNNGRAATYFVGKGEIEKKWGFVDGRGKEIVPVEYDEVTYFDRDGISHLKKGEKQSDLRWDGQTVDEVQPTVSKGIYD
ncbi:MAG: WG repeat-containing protein [Bacteroides sp.]|nr:WG repeat-containing protein [Bacteroides sp.]